MIEYKTTTGIMIGNYRKSSKWFKENTYEFIFEILYSYNGFMIEV